jgi:hypothetical protein
MLLCAHSTAFGPFVTLHSQCAYIMEYMHSLIISSPLSRDEAVSKYLVAWLSLLND